LVVDLGGGPMTDVLSPGTSLTGYVVQEVIGRGGMGVVYRAIDVRLERPVALKLIAPELAGDPRFRDWFLRESRLAASLRHPHVLPIHAAGEEDGQLYLAMRFVEGQDLKALLEDEGALQAGQALRICGQVAEALDAAHAKGLVHRDVKPGNVLLDERGEAYLADFGLSTQLAGDSTHSGRLAGTLDYLAPEQIRGEQPDGSTDQYALACLLYECLAGKPPFRRETEAETLWAHMQEEPPALRGYPALDPVLGKGLAKDKAERYPSCGELLAAAHAALGLEAPAVRRRRLRLGRRLLVAAAGIAVAVVELTGGGSSAIASVPPNSLVSIIANAIGARGTVSRIEPQSNELVGTTVTRVGLEPDLFAPPTPSAIAVGSGSAWANGNPRAFLARFSTHSGAARRPALLGQTRSVDGIALGEDAVWISSSADDTVLRVDPATRRVTAVIRIAAADERVAGHYGIAVGGGSVWVADSLANAVSRIDPRLRAVTATIPVGLRPTNVAVGEKGVWVLNRGDGTVSRIDPTTNTVSRVVRVGGHLTGVATGAGAVWVTVAGGSAASTRAAAPELAKALPASSCSEVARAGAARAFADNPSLLALIGSYNSFCSGLELPITNASPSGPLATISPSNTYVGLTTSGPATSVLEPDQYYPTGVRSFLRLPGHDQAQGAADALLARRLGLRRIYLLDDGTGTAVADRVARARPDGVYVAGWEHAVEVIRDLKAALGRGVTFFAPDNILNVDTFYGRPPTTGLYISYNGRPLRGLGTAGKRFLAAFRARYGRPVVRAEVVAAAQAAEIALDVIARSKGTRASVVNELHRIRVVNGELGSFGFDRNGDPTQSPFTIWRFPPGRPTHRPPYTTLAEYGGVVDRVLLGEPRLAEARGS
jgi:YVTN family beta-propeller protein